MWLPFLTKTRILEEVNGNVLRKTAKYKKINATFQLLIDFINSKKQQKEVSSSLLCEIYVINS